MSGGHSTETPRAAKRFVAAVLVFVFFGGVYEYNTKIAKIVPDDLVIRDEVRLTSKVKLSGNAYEVKRVVDGDTLLLALGEKQERVRLIGVNTPETVDPRKPVECFGKEASAYMKSLVDGKTVYIETDETQGERDKYGRILAYVYLEDGQMVNRKILAEGYAYEYTYLKPYKYQSAFKEAVSVAKSAKVGLWSDGACGLQNIQ